MQRSYPYVLVSVLAFVAALAVVSRANAEPRQVAVTTKIAEATVGTWRCQDQLGAVRTRSGQEPWSLPRSHAYRAWVLSLWTTRRSSCLQVLHRRAEVWRRLERGLSGTPMAGTQRELETAGRRWHISPYFIAAIAGTESSFGFASCSSNRYNAYGLANCAGIWGVPAFTSWADSYEFMGRFLSTRWPDARTTYDFGGYAACSQCWGARTEQHMRQRFGVSGYVRY